MGKGRLQDLLEAKQLVNQGAKPPAWGCGTPGAAPKVGRQVYTPENGTQMSTQVPHPQVFREAQSQEAKMEREPRTAPDEQLNKTWVPTQWGAA